jgi:sulfate permease, SulP family
VTARWRGPLRVASWLKGYDRESLRLDAVAGLTVAVTLIPQGMAYAALAGMPPITGLYAALGALFVYAFLGTSSHLAMGPAALVALVTASGLDPVAGGDPARYALLAASLAVAVGVIQVVMGGLRLGAVVRFVSHPVIAGFTSAAVLIIAVSQARDLLGIDVERTERFGEALTALVAHAGETNAATLAVGAASLAALFAGRWLAPRVPVTLFVAAVATAAAFLLDLPRFGVAVLAEVPTGLPQPTVPDLTPDTLRAVGTLAVIVALISFTESVSVAKAIAVRSRERIAPNRELAASGAANVGAGLLGGFPVAGSFSRSALNFEAGARTPAAGLFTAAGVVLTLLLFADLFAYLPRAVLAAIVIAAVLGLVDLGGVRQTFRTSRPDGAVLVFTFAATLALGIEAGILAGIGLNLLLYLLRHTRPHVAELGRVVGTTTFRNRRRYPTVTDAEAAIVRLDAPLNFLTVDAITNTITALVAKRPRLRVVVLDASAITDLDATGVHALEALARDLAQAGAELHLATVRGPVRDVLQRSGLWAQLGGDRWHPDIDTALGAAGIDCEAPLRRPGAGEDEPPGLV